MIRVEACEINSVRHCVNRCSNCNHASAFADPYEMLPEILDRDLNAMKKIMHVRFFCIQGGEPMLHSKLMEMMRVLAESGMADQPAILTNARLSRQMPEEFWSYLGSNKFELRVSVYPNLDPTIKPYVDEKSAKYGFRVRWQIINSFVKIFAKHNDPQTIYKHCPWRRCLTIHDGYFYLCPLSTFWPSEFMNLPAHIDGISIDGITEVGLQQFLNRETFLESCRICSGAGSERVDWHENRTKEEWLKEAGI